MTPAVLILSSIHDLSIDLVCLKLHELGTKYLRLNREQFQSYRLSLDPQVPTLTVRLANQTHYVDQSLKAIWFRQPVFLRNTPAEPLSLSQQLERSQWTAFLRALSVFDEVAWMNFPANTYLSESKPYQLYTAHRCGFSIPETRISNDASEIKRSFPNSAVIKSLDTILLHEKEDCLFTYSTISTTATISDGEVHQAPLLAQELLSNKIDLRVTLVGDKIFAVKILSDGQGIEGDWRITPREKIQYSNVYLTEKLRNQCHMLSKTLGLSYAAIDLIETLKATYFIEVNPTGEWEWLNSKSRPIASTIAEWLSNPYSNIA